LTFVSHIKEIHIEPTTVCQAECSMCPRTVAGYHLDKNKNTEIDLNMFKTLIGPYISSLEKILFCGVLGDPAASKDLLKMIEWSIEQNNNIVIGMNTNGGLRNGQWWEKLAQLTRENIFSYVVFSIDGLEDTNHIYRKNVVWKNLIENAKSFIDNGGNAQWDSLIFKHNQHQVEEMKQLAQSLKFNIFRIKVSSRFTGDDKVGPPDGGVPVIESTEFSCMAVRTGTLYLSAAGKWYPCCHIHNAESFNQFENWGFPIVDVDSRNIEWKSLEQRIDKKDMLPDVCKRSCGTTEKTKQWVNEWNLNV